MYLIKCNIKYENTGEVISLKKVAVMGNIDHGKTKLLSAIAFAFDGEKRNVSENPEMIFRTEAEIEFGGEKYLFFDYPEDISYEENLDGTEDFAVIVIAATDGPMSGTEKAIELCKEKGIEKIAVFMSMCDLVDDEEIIELVEMDVQEMLSEYGMDDVPFVRGSARNTLIERSVWADGTEKLVETVAGLI